MSRGIEGDQPKHSLWQLEYFLDFAAAKNFHIESQGQNIQVVVVGEQHGREDLMHAFLELVEQTNPKAILLEGLTDGRYDPNEDIMFRRRPDGISEIITNASQEVEMPMRLLLEMAKVRKIPLIGIGRRSNDPLKHRSPSAGRTMIGVPVDVEQINRDYQALMAARDEEVVKDDAHMSERIATEALKHGGPVLVLVGATHARNFHQNENLKNQNLSSYVIIDMTKPASAELHKGRE